MYGGLKMCVGGGGGGGSFIQEQLQINLATAQMAQTQQLADQQLTEQKREFDIQSDQAAQSLANEKDQQAKAQALADQQAALTNQWETGRAAEQAQGTKDVNDAFAQFTPDYYQKFVNDYMAHYQPQLDRQYDLAKNNVTYGLARSGNLASQTAADQAQNLAIQKGQAQADLSNQAIQAKSNLQNQVAGARQNLMGQVTSDATLGSPITPGSADAINASFNNTSAALAQIRNSAGDIVSSLSAVPQYSSLGSLFGGLSNAATSAFGGAQYYNYNQAFGQGYSGGVSSASSHGSGRTVN